MQVIAQVTRKRVGMKEGDLCVWWWRDGEAMEYGPVATSDEAREMLEGLAAADLADTSVTANSGGLEVYEDGEWSEWYDEDGNSIDDLIEEAGDTTDEA